MRIMTLLIELDFPGLEGATCFGSVSRRVTSGHYGDSPIGVEEINAAQWPFPQERATLLTV
jgi:hypothetical protein